MVLLDFQRRRLRFPAIDEHLLELVARVQQKVILSSRAEIWQRESQDSFIVSTYNVLFDAVIVSDAMREAISAQPESGEALLAFHLLRLPKRRWIHDLIGSLTVFLLVSIATEAFFVPILFSVYLPPSPLLSILFTPISLIVPFGAVILLLMRSAFWTHEAAFEIVEELYGIHPQVAKVQVERGRNLDEDERRAVLWGVLEWEKKKRGNRRLGIVLLTMVLALLVPVLVLLAGGYFYEFYLHVFSTIPAATAFAGIVAYLVIRHWDRNAMKEVEFTTQDAREPIWMD